MINTYGISGNEDSFLLAVINQVIALEHRMAFDLVGGRDNAGPVD